MPVQIPYLQGDDGGNGVQEIEGSVHRWMFAGRKINGNGNENSYTR